MRKFLYVALIGSLALWGLTFPLMKIALEEAEPMTMALVRFAITFPFIFVFAWPIKNKGKPFNEAAIRPAFLIAFFAVVLGNLFQNYGLQWTTAGMASVLQEMAPLFTIILAMWFLKERVNRYIVGGALIAFAGTVMLFYEPDIGSSSFIGNLLMIMTALMYAFSSLVSKKALSTIHPVTLTVMVHGIGLVLLLPLTMVLEIDGVMSMHTWSFQTWMAITVLAIFPTALGPIVWYYAMRESTLSSLSILTYLIPMFAITFDLLLTGTAMAGSSILFGIILITGVVIAQRGSVIAKDEHGQHF